MSAECFLAQFAPDVPCEGRICKCHLLPRALMRREYPYGLILIAGKWLKAEHPRLELREGQRWSLNKLLHNEQACVPGCGAGGQGHHGMLDFSRTLRIPRAGIPREVESFARQIGLVWWLDREYADG